MKKMLNNKKGVAPLFLGFLPMALTGPFLAVVALLIVCTSVVVFMGLHTAGKIFTGHEDQVPAYVPQAVEQMATETYQVIEQAKADTGSNFLGWVFGILELLKKYWWVFLLLMIVISSITGFLGYFKKMLGW
jgi:hypothetical protein